MWNWPDNPALNEVFVPIPGKSYTWDGLAWTRRRASVSAGRMGDVKSGFQTADHEGWVLLDGRAVSTLTITQQAEAAILGFTANLPNGDKCSIRMDPAAALGLVGGSQKILQGNLPAINVANSAVLTSSGNDPGAVTSSASGAHNHGIRWVNTTGTPINYNTFNPNDNTHGIWWNHTGGGWHSGNETYDKAAVRDVGNHTHTIDMPNHTHTVPAHGHSLGGSGTDYYVKAIVANLFLYLGD